MIGRILVIVGLVIVFIGLVFTFAPKIPFLGKLPGDIYVKRDKFIFYFPLATSIVISIILSFVLYLISRR